MFLKFNFSYIYITVKRTKGAVGIFFPLNVIFCLKVTASILNSVKFLWLCRVELEYWYILFTDSRLFSLFLRFCLISLSDFFLIFSNFSVNYLKDTWVNVEKNYTLSPQMSWNLQNTPNFCFSSFSKTNRIRGFRVWSFYRLLLLVGR